MKYFISYAWKTTRPNAPWRITEEITSEHPIKFLIRLREEHSEERGFDKSVLYGYEYGLLFWAKISDSLAEELKERMG